MPTAITKWLSSDHKEHDDEATAVRHEKFLEIINVMRQYCTSSEVFDYKATMRMLKYFDVTRKIPS